MAIDKVCVVGLGYIGLPTAAVFASRKFQVLGLDVNQDAVDTINRGEIHIVEPDLDMVVNAAVGQGYLRASTKPEPAGAFLIAVPTPFKGDQHQPDLSYVEAAAKSIAPVLKEGDLVILESTSPVGTTEKVARWMAEARPDLTFPQQMGEKSDIRVAHCPERVLPGHVLSELVYNDRVIGGMTTRCAAVAADLYRAFLKGECILTTARTAEMCKLAENSFRDVNIAFANELSMICDSLDVDVWELVRLANRHPRVNILQPGPGVGGHCIAVDPWFIVSSAPDQSRLITTARHVNDDKPLWVINRVKAAVADFLRDNPDKSIRDITIACYGLAFKADIDDLRESPALDIARTLMAEHGGPVKLVEPNLNRSPDWLSEDDLVTFDQALDNADVHVLLVDHAPFKRIRPQKGLIVDTRGIW